MKKILSKSQANLFLQCPYKWKKVYLDKISSIPSPAQARGISIHKKIEKFYKNLQPDIDLKHFLNFELKRIKDMIKKGKFDKKYFYPIFQELKMKNEELGLKGICDAVFINPNDDRLICIDFKTGKHYGNGIDDYRFELAIYSELLRCSGKIDEEPKYWGILFTDLGELYFEKIDKKYIDDMYKTMDEVRKQIETEIYNPKKNKWCFNCQFKKDCPLMRWGT